MWNAVKEWWKELDEPLFSDHWTVKRVLLVAIAVLLFLGFIAGPREGKAAAPTEMIYQDKTVTVTITAEPCSDPRVVSWIEPDMLPLWRKAVVLFQGRVYGACYTPIDYQDEKVVLIVDESGDSGILPLRLFRNKADAAL